MKIFHINGGVFGSTGKIMFGISETAEHSGYEVKCAAPITTTNRKRNPNRSYIKIGTYYSRLVSVFIDRITGFQGCTAVIATIMLLRKIKSYKPDIIHLHILHGNYINLPLLFSFIKKYNYNTVWTLHDCWVMTGQCPYFTMVKCEKWKKGCHTCPQIHVYPSAYVDRTRTMWNLKKKWFQGVRNLVLVTPSYWLMDLVKQSYMKDYLVKVIYNGIDLQIFKPTESDFRSRLNLNNKFIILGVAYGWGQRKGLDVFIELANRLDESYQIILVGTDNNIDQLLPQNIISIHRTQNQQELAIIYTAADLFVNPTREEVLGNVNIESLACGTPVVTFMTGGCPEIVDNTCGSIVECDDVDKLETEIKRIRREQPYTREMCVARARNFDMNKCFKEYVDLYERIFRK